MAWIRSTSVIDHVTYSLGVVTDIVSTM